MCTPSAMPTMRMIIFTHNSIIIPVPNKPSCFYGHKATCLLTDIIINTMR